MRGLPRLGGGVSWTACRETWSFSSSPPRRGCFLRKDWIDGDMLVFPASAGVFPAIDQKSKRSLGLPRLGGGVSRRLIRLGPASQSSPPRRGCFFPAGIFQPFKPVFPASAGVFLSRPESREANLSLPRLGGGVSDEWRMHYTLVGSSPPRRGCFYRNRYGVATVVVFPASAGVFLRREGRIAGQWCLPRLGGGVSDTNAQSSGAGVSSEPITRIRYSYHAQIGANRSATRLWTGFIVPSLAAKKCISRHTAPILRHSHLWRSYGGEGKTKYRCNAGRHPPG